MLETLLQQVNAVELEPEESNGDRNIFCSWMVCLVDQLLGKVARFGREELDQRTQVVSLTPTRLLYHRLELGEQEAVANRLCAVRPALTGPSRPLKHDLFGSTFLEDADGHVLFAQQVFAKGAVVYSDWSLSGEPDDDAIGAELRIEAADRSIDDREIFGMSEERACFLLIEFPTGVEFMRGANVSLEGLIGDEGHVAVDK